MNNHKLGLVITENIIGEIITVSYNDSDFSITGLVINETKNTIKLKDNNIGKIKIFPKNRITIEKIYRNKRIKFKGSLLKGRIEERLKQEPKKFW